MKELEHRKVKRLAGEILGQRGDVEAFFLQVAPSPSSRLLRRAASPARPGVGRGAGACGGRARAAALQRQHVPHPSGFLRGQGAFYLIGFCGFVTRLQSGLRFPGIPGATPAQRPASDEGVERVDVGDLTWADKVRGRV